MHPCSLHKPSLVSSTTGDDTGRYLREAVQDSTAAKIERGLRGR